MIPHLRPLPVTAQVLAPDNTVVSDWVLVADLIPKRPGGSTTGPFLLRDYDFAASDVLPLHPRPIECSGFNNQGRNPLAH